MSKYQFEKNRFFQAEVDKLDADRPRKFRLFLYLELNNHLMLLISPETELTEDLLKKYRGRGMISLWCPEEDRPHWEEYLKPDENVLNIEKTDREYKEQTLDISREFNDLGMQELDISRSFNDLGEEEIKLDEKIRGEELTLEATTKERNEQELGLEALVKERTESEEEILKLDKKRKELEEQAIDIIKNKGKEPPEVTLEKAKKLKKELEETIAQGVKKKERHEQILAKTEKVKKDRESTIAKQERAKKEKAILEVKKEVVARVREAKAEIQSDQKGEKIKEKAEAKDAAPIPKKVLEKVKAAQEKLRELKGVPKEPEKVKKSAQELPTSKAVDSSEKENQSESSKGEGVEEKSPEVEKVLAKDKLSDSEVDQKTFSGESLEAKPQKALRNEGVEEASAPSVDKKSKPDLDLKSEDNEEVRIEASVEEEGEEIRIKGGEDASVEKTRVKKEPKHAESKVAVKALRNADLSEPERQSEVEKVGKKLIEKMAKAKGEQKEAVLKEIIEVAEDIIFEADDNFDLAQATRELRESSGLDAPHSGIVSALSVLFAMGMGHTEPETLAELSYGAALHDLGLSETFSEKDESHPKLGVELGVKHGLELGVVSRAIILDHHERFNHSGFPAKKGGLELTEWAQIVAIADQFDDYLSGRMDGTPRTPEEAFKMVEYNQYSGLDKATVPFNPEVFESIAQIVRPYFESEAA